MQQKRSSADAEQRVAVLWTGGKDSALALFRAITSGAHVVCLATFAPPAARFLAHPLDMMQLQASALNLPHTVLPVAAPYEQGYELALGQLREQHKVTAVVTGDIAVVDSQPNWIKERCRASGIEACMPLWGIDRESLLQELRTSGFSVMVSCVNTRCLPPSWVGRMLDEPAVDELRTLRLQNGLDLAGENGEYHTVVLDGPGFRQRIRVESGVAETRDEYAYLAGATAVLVDR